MVSNFVMKCHGGGGGEGGGVKEMLRNFIIGITIDNYHTNVMREQICVQKTSVKILGL